MGETTTIAWTDTTWNPVTGCTKVSPGCDHCYAERITHRWGREFSKIEMHRERLFEPFHWRKPRMIFTCSMSDLFHSAVPFDFLHKVMSTMASNPRHIFQILTKRPGRLSYFANIYHPPLWDDRGTTWGMQWRANVWVGTSVESAKYLPRLDVLARVPAKVRFLSAEPLLGPLDLRPWIGCVECHENEGRDIVCVRGNVADPTNGRDPRNINWVIVGGESGPGHRPMQTEWVQNIADQCAAAGVPLFVKQGSGRWPGQQGDLPDNLWALKEMPVI